MKPKRKPQECMSEVDNMPLLRYLEVVVPKIVDSFPTCFLVIFLDNDLSCEPMNRITSLFSIICLSN